MTPQSTPMGTPVTTANSVVNANTADIDKLGVFTSPQSLFTFTGGVTVVTTVWKVIGTVYPPFGSENKVVPVAIALLFGILVYLASVSKATSWRQKLIEISIAIFNSFTIAAAVLGIS